jgi:S-adenosylmethionine decarboxylase
METKGGKKSKKSSVQYESPLGYGIEDVRPHGGSEKFRTAAYSNVRVFNNLYPHVFSVFGGSFQQPLPPSLALESAGFCNKSDTSGLFTMLSQMDVLIFENMGLMWDDVQCVRKPS